MKVPALFLAAAALAGCTTALDRKFYGLNYDVKPASNSGCKDAGTIGRELAAFKATTDTIRVYATACTGDVIDAATKNNMKVWVGLWADLTYTHAFDDEFNKLKKLVESKKITNDNTVGIQVASEALYRWYIQGKHDANDKTGVNWLIGNIKRVRDYLRQNNINIPVTIADVMDGYNMFPELYEAVDVVSVNQFSMWEKVKAVDGVNTLFSHWPKIMEQAKAAGKPVVISETGWSAADDKNLVVEASPEAQALYARDFLAFAEKQSINYFYFSAIDLAHQADLIEKTFGIFDNSVNLKSGIRNIHIGKAPVATRLFHGDKVLKVDPSNWNALKVEAPATGLGQNLDNELWFYNEATQSFYSKSSNQCLDAYGDTNNALNVHVYNCDGNNANQKWTFTSDNHLKNMNGGNQCMDVDPNQKDKVQMWWCYDGPNQLFKKRDLKDEKITITAGNAQLYEWYGGVQAKEKPQYADNTHWFYDPISQLLKSKAASNDKEAKCLDAYQNGNEVAVHLWTCDANNANQKWQYNDVTGQWMHGYKLGLCLDAAGGDNLKLAFCDKTKGTQKWTLGFAK